MGLLKKLKISSIKCVINSHYFETIRDVNEDIREVRCINCNKEFVIYDGISNIIPLDDEMRSIHSSLIFSKLRFRN